MEINIGLDPNFSEKFYRLKNKYGKQLAYINGLSEDQLNYNEFINNFIDTQTVADSSIDGNSNVSHKDIVTLEKEMPKPHRKLLSFNKIYYEIQKKYDKTTGDKWLEYEWTGKLYMHDPDTSSMRSYCFAYSLEDLATKGLYFIEGRNATPAKHLITFVDFVKEFISFASNRTSGACGLPDLIPYMFYFWKKDIDNDYMGIKTSHNEKYYAMQAFQRFIYAVNQPFVRDGSQSAFTNTSVFDRPYFEALFGGSEFPDGTFMIDYEEEIIEFQKWYMEEMSAIRSENMFTFPVSTISLLVKEDPDGNKFGLDNLDRFEDQEFAVWAIRHNMKWSDSNIFTDTSVNSLSNCCFDGSQLCLSKTRNGVNYMTFKQLYDAPFQFKQDLTVYHNGFWVPGKVIRIPNERPMYRVTTANKKTMLLTDNHLNLTLRGEVPTSELTTDDYLMFNTRTLEAVKEVDQDLSYEQGMLIGMYLGDGSMYDEDASCNTTINLSLNEEKYERSKLYLQIAIDIIVGIDPEEDVLLHLNTPHNNVYPVTIRSNEVAQFVRQWVSGGYCFNKTLNMNCLLQSAEFRKGILDGYYLTDGGNSNRIYTTSVDLVYQMEALITSLGLQSMIDMSDRRGEGKVVIRGQSFNRNYPVYCIRWYQPSNRRTQKDIFINSNNSQYFKIVNIEPYTPLENYVYCFEMKDQTYPYFTLPNGIITHNCRLKSDIKALGYFNSIGSTALKVGSVKVSTINLARLALDSNSEEEFIDNLKDRVHINLIALEAVRHIIKRNVEKGLLPNFKYNLIDFDHIYNTIGFIGCYEAIKKFNYIREDEFGNTFYTDEAFAFGEKIFKTMRAEADKFIEDTGADYMINIEQIPGESAAAKLMKKDKLFYPDANIYDLPLYGNQFMPLGIQTTLDERIKTQAKFDSYCNGG